MREDSCLYGGAKDLGLKKSVSTRARYARAKTKLRKEPVF